MGLTVTDEASLYYNLNSFSNSSTYQSSGVNTSSITKSNYNVTDLTNALDSLSRTDTVSFSSIGNVDSYAKNAYEISQLNDYSSLAGNSGNVSGLLSNTSNMYKLLSYNSALDSQLTGAIMNNDSFDSTATGTNPYNSYLNGSTSASVLGSAGSILDMLV